MEMTQMSSTSEQRSKRIEELKQVEAAPSPQEVARVEREQLEHEEQVEREANAVEAATAWQKGLRRASGSKRARRDELLKQLADAAAAVAATCEGIVAVDADLQQYELQDAAIVDRFGVPSSTFPRLPSPGVASEAV